MQAIMLALVSPRAVSLQYGRSRHNGANPAEAALRRAIFPPAKPAAVQLSPKPDGANDVGPLALHAGRAFPDDRV
jgi:hypothetical protein